MMISSRSTTSNSLWLLLVLFFLAGGLVACGNQMRDLPDEILSPIDNKKMILIPDGEFIMGTDKVDEEKTHLKVGTVKPLFLDQQPERKISLPAFYIDQFEVTQIEYKRFIDETLFNEFPSHWENGSYPEGQALFPVTNITWREALAYALWAGKTLPTEEQWEKSSRGFKGSLYPWGDDYQKGFANIGLDGLKKLAAVGSYPRDKSPFGVFDMAGNVMEWTLDWYDAYPGSSYKHKKMGRHFKVLRGNGFQNQGHYFLDAYRYAFHRTEVDPDEYYENVGFRCVMKTPK